ncbi:MAG: NAD+ synthase (glutamine-hydrolysing) NadE [Bacteroidetes bacterium HLUCCA01]|nr:MAG: NAD+ synthase (glutamine-hydrolysing) NadE [Bacteroidetes bacterium HLUCCA01]
MYHQIPTIFTQTRHTYQTSMRIRLQQLNTIVGDIKGNTQQILTAYRQACEQGLDLLILPELAVSGYPPMDLLEREVFRNSVYQANQQIISQTRSTALIFGTFTNNPGSGRKMFNAALSCQDGRLLAETHKTLLPTYDIFDEYRYFEPNQTFAPVEINGCLFGITICEDIWNSENEIIYHVYDENPARRLQQAGARVIVNVSASPFSKGKAPIRLKMLQNHARSLDLPILYANQVGANTEVLFDGDTMALDRRGNVVATTTMFESSCTDVNLNTDDGTLTPESPFVQRDFSVEERTFRALVMGIRDYLNKSALPPRVVLGLSGGIDSALVATLACEAVGAAGVTGLTMPSEFSSAGSVSDSHKLARALGMKLHEVPIASLYTEFSRVLAPLFTGTPFNVAEENLQSRIRGVLLMGMSNKFGSILLNTGNKSELAVGYCTLYGDMNGGLSVIADLYKTEVYNMANWLNDSYYGREVIPAETLVKPPSAELRPDQKDSDSLPEYDVLDGILRRYIEEQRSREEIVRDGFDTAVVDRVIGLVDLNEYKRRQSPPGLRLSAKAFGIGRRLPIVQGWTRHGL